MSGIATVVPSSFANPLNKALAVNSYANDWQAGIFTSRPSAASIDFPPQSFGPAQGLWTAIQGVPFQAERLFLQPICEGSAGSQFSMRLWGWKSYGPYRGDGPRELQTPFFIAEFLLTACNCPGPQSEGPAGQPSLRPQQPGENLCDTAILVQGDLGIKGWINMTGTPATSNGPAIPTDLPGYILIELQGAVRYQFDFKQVDPNVGMNCFFATM